ncbi:MAG TPA: dockerin type I domain-containing protein [Phycisphaerae bacterium]|nr:dockerin type I domain-containing protein [Phycisphaerae bacterium]HRR86642.1 dockerin type I domain-containing protein [Phycisphaerae bacterium]
MFVISPAWGRSTGADKHLPIRLATVMVAASLIFCISEASAACGFDWKPGESPQGLSYEGYAMAVYDDGGGPALYVAGGFETAGGVKVCGVARWDGRYWSPVGGGVSKPSGCGQVKALVVHDGELVAAGSFAMAGNTAAANIARWNGSRWAPLGEGTNFDVLALAIYGNDLIAAGNFTTAGGVSANRIARWNGETWSPLGSGLNDAVGTLHVHEGELIAGGRFTMAGGLKANQIARWNGSEWQSVGGGVTAGSNPNVSALLSYGDHLVVGGFFAALGGVACKNIGIWDGSKWAPLGEGTDASVLDLTLYNGELIAGGFFEKAGGKPARHIARWDGETWSPLAGGLMSYVIALAVYGDDLIATGSGTVAGGVRADNIARWDGTRWFPLGAAMDHSPYAFADYNGELIAGGEFTYLNGVRCNGIARWSGSAWVSLGEGVAGGKDGTQVRALTVYRGELIAGGNFAQAGRVGAKNVARWNGSSWAPLGQGFNGPVRALIVCKGELIAGGTFTTSGGTTLNGIARWDGEAWMPLGNGVSGTWSPGVYCLAAFAGDLYAGGLFLKAGGETVNHVARWDGAEWHSLTGGVTGSGYPDVPVTALAVFNDELIAGGLFTAAGGVHAAGVARWDGKGWSAMEDENAGGPRQVHSLAVHNGQLIVGGSFPSQGLLSADGLGRWDGAAWSPVGRGIAMGSVYAMAVHRGELLAGGSFLAAGGKTSARFARWAPVEPTVEIHQWRSSRYHGGSISGELAVRIDASATTGRRITTETRQGGVQKIIVDITGPEDGRLELEGRVAAEEVGGAGYSYPAVHQTLTHDGEGSYTLVLEWPEGLPDQQSYRIDLGANLTCLKGDTDALIRSLTGDVTGDGVVDSADLLEAKSRISRPVMPDNIIFDVNIDGSLNATDVLTIRAFQDRAAMSP